MKKDSIEAKRTPYGWWLWRGDDSHGRFVPDDDSDLAILQAEITALREAVLWLNDNAGSFPGRPDHVLARVIQSRRVLGMKP